MLPRLRVGPSRMLQPVMSSSSSPAGPDAAGSVSTFSPAKDGKWSDASCDGGSIGWDLDWSIMVQEPYPSFSANRFECRQEGSLGSDSKSICTAQAQPLLMTARLAESSCRSDSSRCALFWGHAISCSSTQDVARAIWEKGTMDGCVITADRQSAGRGTWGRSWWSHPGNLLLSIAVPRHQACQSLHSLPLLAAGVVIEWLHSLGAQTALRGVNDVILLRGPDQKPATAGLEKPVSVGKVCGLLVESWDGRRGEALTLGLGLNCAVAPSSFQAQQATTSLRDHGIELEALQVATALLPQLLSLCGIACRIPDGPQLLSGELVQPMCFGDL